jgi:hypothetical protein
MRHDHFVWIDKDTYNITSNEPSVPAGKIAARVNLTHSEREAIRTSTDWHEYQGALEHLFERGQLIVPLNS